MSGISSDSLFISLLLARHQQLPSHNNDSSYPKKLSGFSLCAVVAISTFFNVIKCIVEMLVQRYIKEIEILLVAL